MKNKKIAFIFPKDSSAIFNRKSEETFGGATVQMFMLAKEFSNYNDINISCLVVEFGHKDEEIINGLKIHNTFSKNDNLFLKIIKFHKAIQKIRPDVIVQHGLTIFSSLLAVYCKVFNIKFVYMFASDVEADGYYQTNHKKAILFKLLIDYSDILVTQNQYQHNKIISKYNRYADILYNGFPVNSSFNNKKDFILWVGRAEKLKQPEKFIKLASLNTNYKFVMICNKVVGQEDYFFNIDLLAKKIENLEFIPRVPFNEIEIYFKRAKIFINTSNYEGFPQAFIQATKNKVPIISLNVNPDNFITEYSCGIICDSKDIVMNQSIEALLSDSHKYDQISKNAYNYARKNHDIKKNARILYNMIFNKF